MPSGALSLKDYPGEVVVIDCPACDRTWTIPKADLIAEHGAGHLLPDLRAKITRCPRAAEPGRYYGRCRAVYPELGRR